MLMALRASYQIYHVSFAIGSSFSVVTSDDPKFIDITVTADLKGKGIGAEVINIK